MTASQWRRLDRKGKNMKSAFIISPLELIRKGFGLTRKELAQHCGVSEQFIFCLEKGKNKPQIDKLKKLQDGLNSVCAFDYRGFWLEFKRLRCLAAISQKKCAKELNIFQAELSAAEHGKAKMKNLVPAAAKIMDIDTKQFYKNPIIQIDVLNLLGRTNHELDQ